jgi:hypothetical protein
VTQSQDIRKRQADWVSAILHGNPYVRSFYRAKPGDEAHFVVVSLFEHDGRAVGEVHAPLFVDLDGPVEHGTAGVALEPVEALRHAIQMADRRLLEIVVDLERDDMWDSAWGVLTDD